MNSTAKRLTTEFIEANRRLAALGVPGESEWTEANCAKLASAIVAAGRAKQLSNAVIIMRAKEYIESVISKRLMAERTKAQQQAKNMPAWQVRLYEFWIARAIAKGLIKAGKQWKKVKWIQAKQTRIDPGNQ